MSITDAQVINIKTFLEGIATGIIDPELAPMMAQFLLTGIEVAEAKADEKAVLAPLRLIGGDR
jgi:hypothetical protein